ncbi:MAG: hypothetical protein WCB99_08335 [Candidatus Cybelea sp.]|jgi:hypothetical protein
MVRYMFLTAALGVALIAAPAAISAQDTSSMSNSDYISKVMGAAPEPVVRGATIITMEKNGSPRNIQTGGNGFTCMLLDPNTPMCADKNAMDWMHALITHTTPPNTVGFIYMLAGDNGTSNTDPFATAPNSSNHWVTTGPHVMIVGPATKDMGYPMTPDPDPSKPFVMWPETPYAHLMIPVTAQP